jgi:hypothetical protein
MAAGACRVLDLPIGSDLQRNPPSLVMLWKFLLFCIYSLSALSKICNFSVTLLKPFHIKGTWLRI